MVKLKKAATPHLKCLFLLALTLLVQSGCGSSAPTSANPAPDKEESGYEQRRTALVADSKDNSLNDKEKIADEKLNKMKAELLRWYGGYTNFPYDIPTMSDSGLTNSALYDFCRKLPKGGDLRSNGCDGLSMDGLLLLLSEREDFHVCLEDGFCYGYMYDADIGPFPDGSIMLKEGMQAGSLSDARLTDMWTLRSLTEFNDPLEKLNKVRIQTECINNDEKLVKQIYKEEFLSYIANNVSFVELRVGFISDSAKNEQTVKLIRSAYYDVKKKNPDFTVRIIAAASKNKKTEKEDIKSSIEDAMRLREQIKDESDKDSPEYFIIGYDLCDSDYESRPLADLEKLLNDGRIKDSGLKAFLTAGDSLSAENTDVADAYLLDAERVGHALNLSRFPELMEKYADRKLCVETCPISNCRMGYTADLRLHPATLYMQAGGPIVLCSDIARYTEHEVLTDDYFAAVMCWDLGLADLKQLAENSIKYSGLTKDEKERLTENWKKDWDNFIEGMQ